MAETLTSRTKTTSFSVVIDTYRCDPLVDFVFPANLQDQEDNPYHIWDHAVAANYTFPGTDAVCLHTVEMLRLIDQTDPEVLHDD